MSEPVSKKAQANTLQTLPLELRLRIYEFVAVRPTGPRLVLKEWLEKIDPNIDTTTPATVTLGQTINANGDLVDSDSDADDGSEAADDVMADGEDEDEDEDEDIDADDGEEDGDADGDADDDLDDADDDVRSSKEKISTQSTDTHTGSRQWHNEWRQRISVG